MSPKHHPHEKQLVHTGKVEHESNKVGVQLPTQTNQGQRTPDSRHDRDTHIGSGNQTQSRRGGIKGH